MASYANNFSTWTSTMYFRFKAKTCGEYTHYWITRGFLHVSIWTMILGCAGLSAFLLRGMLVDHEVSPGGLNIGMAVGLIIVAGIMFLGWCIYVIKFCSRHCEHESYITIGDSKPVRCCC